MWRLPFTSVGPDGQPWVHLSGYRKIHDANGNASLFLRFSHYLNYSLISERRSIHYARMDTEGSYCCYCPLT